MTVRPVGAEHVAQVAARSGADAVKEGGFERLVRRFLAEARAAEAAADRAVAGLATGEASSVHGVMLAVAQAELAVRLVMEVRDRLIQTYTELQRIQV